VVVAVGAGGVECIEAGRRLVVKSLSICELIAPGVDRGLG
jgi:hypothetical protein